MKKRLYLLLAFGVLFLIPTIVSAGNFWQQAGIDNTPKNLQVMHPVNFLVYTMDEATMKLQMFSLSNNPADGIIISLPLPDGSFRDFNVWQTPMMPGELAAKYPDIKTFTAEAVDNRNVTAKLDFTIYGFHAMIYDGANTSFIDPFDNFHDGFYMVHYRRDETRAVADRMKCDVHTFDENGPAGESMDIVQKGLPKLAFKITNGYQLRTYRLALACDNEYAQAATGLGTPTVAQAFSKMTTTMNRVNGVYERELSITMNFVNNEDALIFTTETGDPYSADNGNSSNLLTDNQTECDAVIGNASYDIGHVFTTGGGGLSLVGVVCQAGNKAQSETGGTTPVGDGFDIDFVAHEMGHEFGANHPFNSNDCGADNINAPTAYEPGSGSTIMAYAGICPPDDLQRHSDAYFHAISLQEIQQYFSLGGDACPLKTATENKPVSYTSFATSYSIPFLTPFELYAPIVSDSVADSTTLYCWEEWDLPLPADLGEEFVNTHGSGPIFRSFLPTTSNLRIFPEMSMVLAGTLNNAGHEGAEGEKVPDVARTVNFKCTFRDIIHNLGCITTPDDEVTLHAINTGSGFAVTSQNAGGILYNGGSMQTITWDVVSTDVAPINAASVDISMSVDGGNTWAYYIGSFPNTGSASVTVPNPATTTVTARFKVKGHGNVFFNVNRQNFVVVNNPGAPVSPNTAGVKQTAKTDNSVKIYPVPAVNAVHITSGSIMQAVVFNSIGQLMWQGQVNKQVDIPVEAWARGIYYMQLTDNDNNRVVKKFVVE